MHARDKGDNVGRFYNTFLEGLVRRPTLKTNVDSLAPPSALDMWRCATHRDKESAEA